MLNVITVNGTASWPQDPFNFPSLVALNVLPSPWQILGDKIDGLLTQPIINWLPLNYPMLTYPMGSSVNTGITNLVNLILATPGKIMVLSYSQGAIVWASVWRDYILNGPLANRKDDIVAAVTWGNPMRAPNAQNGNIAAGWPLNSGGGISGTNDLLPSQVPSWWYDYTDANDLYTDSPGVSFDGTKIVLTDTSKDEMLIYNLIVTTNFGGTLVGLLKIVEQLVEEFTSPWTELVGIVTAIFNGLKFLGAGPAAGHYTYDPGPAIDYTRQVALQYL